MFLFQLLANSQGQISIAAMNTVAEVLHKLLVVGITDTGEWKEGGHYKCRSLKLGERLTPQNVHASPKFNAYIGAP